MEIMEIQRREKCLGWLVSRYYVDTCGSLKIFLRVKPALYTTALSAIKVLKSLLLRFTQRQLFQEAAAGQYQNVSSP